MKRINYKQKCLEINPLFRCSKVRGGCSFYHIITGDMRIYKPYSSYKDTPAQAWKDCYERLTKIETA